MVFQFPRPVQAPPFPALPELPPGQQSPGLTCQGQFGARGVELCRALVRIHAVPQGQLRHPLAVLLPEVVRDGCIVLSSVGEGLGTQQGTLVSLGTSPHRGFGV